MRTLLCLALFATGCPGGTLDTETSDTGEDTDTSSGTDADTSPDTDADTLFEPDQTGDMSGTTFGDGGYATAGVVVRLCQETCDYEATSDADGLYTLSDIEPGTYMMEASLSAETDWLVQSAPILVPTNAVIDLNPFLVRAAETVATPDSTEVVRLAPELSVTLDPTQVVTPNGETEFLGATVQPEWLAPTNVPGTLLGAWYLGPYDATSGEAGFALTFDNAWDLASGDSASVYTNVYGDNGPEWTLAGTVSGGGDTLTGDVSVPRLATVLLIQP